MVMTRRKRALAPQSVQKRFISPCLHYLVMRLYLAADHGGFELKELLKPFLAEKGLDVIDLGTNSKDSVDYPDFALELGKKVAGENVLGVLICGTGIGMSIAANKVKGVRAALAYDENTAKLAKEHNNANVLCLGGRTTTPGNAEKILSAWLDAKFQGDRHERRVNKIDSFK